MSKPTSRKNLIDRSAKVLSPTQFQLQQLRLPVSDSRFENAMRMAARDMGATFDRGRSVIYFPKGMARDGDKSFPAELSVLYRKFPCGMIMRNIGPGDAAAGSPCVSFDIIPKVPGDPRRSKLFKSFQGDTKECKVLFGKFLGWLKIISRTIQRYNRQSGRVTPFSRMASQEEKASSVADNWLAQWSQKQ